MLIRNASANDAKILGKWWRDGNVMAHAGFPNGISITDEEIVKQLTKDSDTTHRLLIMEVNNIAIGEMNYRNMGAGTAEIGIKICDFAKQETGYGSVLIRMLIRNLFNQNGYNRIILSTNLNNLRAQHVYEKIGFRKIAIKYGSWRNQLGELQSSIDYELDKKDFVSSQ